MATHTIEVTEISDELLQLLDERVRQHGGDRAGFIRELIRKELQKVPLPSHGDDHPHPSMSFEEILAPVHQQVAASGMTEAEVDRLFEEARQKVRETKRAVRSR